MKGDGKAAELEALRAEVSRLRAELASSRGNVLRTVAEQLPDNLMLLDRDRRIQYINWTVPDLTPEQVVGTHPNNYLPQTFHEHTEAVYCQVLETGEPGRYEVEYVAEDASISCWESRVASIRGPEGVEGLAVISNNVTERREAAMDRDRVFALSMDMFCVVSQAGYFKRLNPAFTSILGWSEEELQAQPFIEFVHADDRPATNALWEELLGGKPVLDFENRYLCKDGSYRVMQWRAVFDSATGMAFATARDRTETQALEARIRQAQKMDAVGQLAGGVAHDFNNLLLAMGMNLSFASRQTSQDGVRSRLDAVQAAVDRAANLTKQLLTFSRSEPLHQQNVDVNERMNGLMGMLRPMLREDISIALELGMDVPTISADPTQIDLVVLNLCINARDAMPSGGSLVLATRKATLGEVEARRLSVASGDFAVIRVTDDGLGMSSDVRERVFEPFYTTKAQGKGTGLGLSTAYGVITQHGGTMECTSAPNEGATFEVYVPSVQAAEAATANPSPGIAAEGSETILVAEDAELVRRAVVEMLKSSGYNVVIAEDGACAVQRVREQGDAIHLALLDVIMPNKGGVEAAAEIAQLYPDMKILFTTGYGGRSFETAGIAKERIVPKPYDPEDLLAAIRTTLDADG